MSFQSPLFLVAARVCGTDPASKEGREATLALRELIRREGPKPSEAAMVEAVEDVLAPPLTAEASELGWPPGQRPLELQHAGRLWTFAPELSREARREWGGELAGWVYTSGARRLLIFND